MVPGEASYRLLGRNGAFGGLLCAAETITCVLPLLNLETSRVRWGRRNGFLAHVMTLPVTVLTTHPEGRKIPLHPICSPDNTRHGDPSGEVAFSFTLDRLQAKSPYSWQCSSTQQHMMHDAWPRAWYDSPPRMQLIVLVLFIVIFRMPSETRTEP